MNDQFHKWIMQKGNTRNPPKNIVPNFSSLPAGLKELVIVKSLNYQNHNIKQKNNKKKRCK